MVYLARKRVFNWWKHNFTYLRQSSLLFSIIKFDYCVSWSSHRQRFRHVYNFPAKKGGGRLGASASPFRGFSEKLRNDEVFSGLPTRFSHFTSNICQIYGVPISKFPWENSRHFAVRMRGKCRNFHWWRVMITSQMVEASSPRDTTKQKHYPG